MELSFIGAAREVTGSCTLLNACGKNILIDCGMYQGADDYEHPPFPVLPQNIDCVLLTHAHIDHSGKIPKLVAEGYRNRIYATEATVKLCNIMLKDSAHIQETEAEWQNRKARRSGEDLYIPLYTMQDVERTLPLFTPCKYDNEYTVFDGIVVKFIDAGHLLGSASILIKITENGVTKSVLFSGDVGNVSRPLIPDPIKPTEGDIVVIESTYGDRVHGERKAFTLQFAKIIQETFDKGGNVIIPAFAVGRTQEILYLLREIKSEGLIQGHKHFPVWIDSPLAVEATKIYAGGMMDYYDAETIEMIKKGIDPLRFDGLSVSVTTQDSVRLNEDDTPKIIISASGMCEAGRIRHHLKHNLWRPESTILFVGYQAVGTLGRALAEGTQSVVKLFGETIEIKAEIKILPGISGHADETGLIDWLSSISPKPCRVFLVHGDDKVCDSFADHLHDAYGYETDAPYSGSQFDLAKGIWIREAAPVAVAVKKTASSQPNTVFARLLAAGQRLLTVIAHNEGGSNKDLAKFTSQINSLCDKWDR